MKPKPGQASVPSIGHDGEPVSIATSTATTPTRRAIEPPDISPDQAVRAQVNFIFGSSGVGGMMVDRLRTLTGVNLPEGLSPEHYGYNFGVVKTVDGRMSAVIEYPNPHRDRAGEPATLQEFFKITEDGTEEPPGRPEFTREILLGRGEIDNLEQAYRLQNPAEVEQGPAVPFLVDLLQRYDRECYITQRGLIITWRRTPEEGEPLGEGEMRGSDGRYNLVMFKTAITSDMVAEVENWLSRQPEGDLKRTVAERFARYQEAVKPPSY